MSENICVINSVHHGPYLQTSKKSFGMQTWLNTDEEVCQVMRGATHPTEEWLDVKLPPKELEPIIDQWFELQGITPNKYFHGNRKDPFFIRWEFQPLKARTTTQ